jgi:hypothetical protein
MTAIAQVAPIAGLKPAPTRSRVADWAARIGAILRQLGPYAAIEILLPGGTLVALLLWLYRRRGPYPGNDECLDRRGSIGWNRANNPARRSAQESHPWFGFPRWFSWSR